MKQVRLPRRHLQDTMGKTRKELQRKLDANNCKIEQHRHQIKWLDNRIQDLRAKQRKVRTHRLITCGAAVESIWPVVKEFSGIDFYALMENILSLPQVLTILHSFRPKSRTTDSDGGEAEKRKIVQDDYDIRMTQTMDRELSVMCNLSKGVREKGIAEGLEKAELKVWKKVP